MRSVIMGEGKTEQIFEGVPKMNNGSCQKKKECQVTPRQLD
jgi:hypothetical protein